MIKQSKKIKFCLMLLFGLTMLPAQMMFAQNKVMISGVVVDDKGVPLTGVNVTVKNNKTRTNTDAYGKFVFQADHKAMIVFSFLGYQKQEMQADVANNKQITLHENATDLDEIVVIGYGSARKGDLSAAISNVKVSNTAERGFTNPTEMLSGTVPGVTVSAVDGQPGAALNLEIRGINSLSGSTQPLFVLDGVPVESLANLNPNDVLSMNVLKDAAATSVYGSRGNNGVILVTTKSGGISKTKIQASYSMGFSQFTRFMDLLDAPTYARYVNELRTNRHYNPAIVYSEDDIANIIGYDHTKEILQTGKTKNANVNISGGDKTSTYYVSGHVFNQEGVIKNTDLTRYSMTSKLSRKLYRNLSLDLQINYTNSTQNGTHASGMNGVVAEALKWNPAASLTNIDGSYSYLKNYAWGSDAYFMDDYVGKVWYNSKFTEAQAKALLTNVTQGGNMYRNPLAIINETLTETKSQNFRLNTTLNYDITKDLKLLGRFALSSSGWKNSTYQPTTVVTSTAWKGQATIANSQTTNGLYELTATWLKKIKKNHINAVLSTNAETYNYSYNYVAAQNFTQDVTGFNSIQSAETLVMPASKYTAYQMLSFVARAMYDYDYKYYFSASSRYDGTSKFDRGNRWGMFPSLSGAYRMSSENFMKDLRFITDLKLRASYGITGGQSAVSEYSTKALLSPYYTTLGDQLVVGYSQSSMPNKDLTWEKTHQTNVGMDLKLFKDRIGLNIDAYYKKTKDLLLLSDVPMTTGFTEMWDNVGTVLNKGIEISLSTQNVKTSDFLWETDFNICFNRNKVIKLNGVDNDYRNVGGYMYDNISLFQLRPGRPVGEFIGYKFVGIYNQQTIMQKPGTFQVGAKEGSRRYADLNGDNILNEEDATVIGSSLPLFTGGFSTSLTYKGVSLSANFAFSYGNDVYNMVTSTLGNTVSEYNLLRRIYNKRYQYLTSDMDDETRQRIMISNAYAIAPPVGLYQDMSTYSNWNIEDGSFFTCREISLSMALPKKLVKKMSLSSFNVFANCTNPLMLTQYTGYNPEVASGSGLVRGVDTGAYPISRTIMFGGTLIF